METQDALWLDIHNSYRAFIADALQRYGKLRPMADDARKRKELYEGTSKPFFDELVAEINRLYKLHRHELADIMVFSKTTRAMAEQGLRDYHAMMS